MYLFWDGFDQFIMGCFLMNLSSIEPHNLNMVEGFRTMVEPRRNAK